MKKIVSLCSLFVFGLMMYCGCSIDRRNPPTPEQQACSGSTPTDKCDACIKDSCSLEFGACIQNDSCRNFDHCYDTDPESSIGNSVSCADTFPEGAAIWKNIVTCACDKCCEECGRLCLGPYGALTN